VLEAFGLGLLGASSLLFAGLLACWVNVPARLVGIMAGFGAGALIAAISFDLVVEAEDVLELWQFAVWMLVGVAIFLVADRMVESRFGQAGVGGAMGIVVGSVVDGVPESVIFGIQVGTGFPISLSFLAAVFISNIPQSIAPSADLSAAGWSARRVGTLWFWIVLACGIAAALGFLATDLSSEATGGRMAALAAGGLLAMLTNSLMPFAYERGGALAGAATAVGFCASLLGSS
jgi:zinc transporter, ZIP family